MNKEAKIRQRDVLLVGSVPLADAPAVFRTVSKFLGPQVRQIPDGETGPRANWIRWQLEVMRAAPFLRQGDPLQRYGSVEEKARAPFVPHEPKSDPAQWQFGPLGYAAAAISSYASFKRLKADGVVGKEVKFQVSLPTPLAPVAAFVAPEFFFAVEGAYERRMRQEIEQILRAIPAHQLAIQWDTAIEFALLENVRSNGVLANDYPRIVERLIRITSWVPVAVDLGFHYCYGDAGHVHFKEPADTALLVKVANSVTKNTHRPLQWIHLPVPIARDDEPYFAPLQGLQLSTGMRLYLGLIHFTDGLAGAKRRIAAAESVVRDFGVATECGFGRRPVEQVEPLLQLHADVLREFDY